jgi:hypothetical protein
MNKKNNYQPVPAKVKVDGKLRDLDVTNISSFMVYKSLIGGNISFECIVASKFGLSMNNSFYDLYVYRHKTKSSQPTLSKDDIIQMRGGASEDEEDENDDAELVDENNEDEDDDADNGDVDAVDAEPVDTDEEPDDEDDEDDEDDDDTPSKPASLKSGKRGKK